MCHHLPLSSFLRVKPHESNCSALWNTEEKKIVLGRYFVLSIALCHNCKSLNKTIVATTALFKDKPFHNNFAVIQYCQEMQYALPS